jgi:bile acid:Na+ symporter, BASS family
MHAFFRTYGKVFALILTMLAGTLVPQASALTFLVQYLLMAMLFFAFLDIEIKPSAIRGNVLLVLLANFVVAFVAFELGSLISPQLGRAAFITAIAPTAISSTVIVGFIRGRVEFMVAAVLLTNIAMALVVPLVLPHVVGTQAQISTWEVLRPVLVTMFTPLILARLARHLPQRVGDLVYAGKKYSFHIWILNLFIVSAKASDFILRENGGSLLMLGQIALVSLVICIINFAIGALIGGRDYWQETSQALGQKNNTFAIWVALTFISPLAAMGPTFYVLYHNLYNTWQIYRFEKIGRNKMSPRDI